MVRIHDLTLRDGLMAVRAIPTAVKLALVGELAACGVSYFEVTRFPIDGQYEQFNDGIELLQRLQQVRHDGIRIDVFAFGEGGIEQALEKPDLFDCLHIASFVSDSYARYAWNEWSWAMTLDQIGRTADRCRRHGIELTVGIGTCFGCPFEGPMSTEEVVERIAEVHRCGVGEVMIGDTIGAAVPDDVRRLLKAIRSGSPGLRIRVHFHDALGRALLNSFAAVEAGADDVDTSLLGFGGEPHPYFLDGAMTQNGNCATEELIALVDSREDSRSRAFAAARLLSHHAAVLPPRRSSFAEIVPYNGSDRVAQH